MRSYRLLTSLVGPFVPLWLLWRAMRGKEDRRRIKERYGIASVARPKGAVLWLHAASVGEANSVLLLISKIRERYSHIHILLTTGTVTSARLMKTRLSAGAIHQFVPIDTPQATLAFIRHWKPNFSFWVESEFWPNLIMAADYYQSFMGVINARMSARSFQRWQKRPIMIGKMLSCFNIVFAQSVDDASRLEVLGAKDVVCLGNLKYDAAMLPCDEGELLRLKQALGSRPMWLAASTHPGEEEQIAQVHKLLSATRPNLLTIIVPRHPERGDTIAKELQPFGRIVRRSRKEPPAADTHIYIADTLGELGLFYRLSEIVFMGGSLVKHGGQNPLEPARLACAIVTGPHTHNFSGIYHDMEREGVAVRVKDAHALASQVNLLLNNATMRADMQGKVRKWTESREGAAERILTMLAPLFEPRKKP